ncbi:MAG: nicotinamide mononucleotide transporter [Paludibacteraceae bacterium]|nr:nicotinamide mononucleotide transporter [Paludibacteraceae bacterium]
MKSVKSILKAELVAGRSLFDWLFLCTGIIVQIAVYIIQPENVVAVVSGITGIISVILCAQGKISTFFFGFLQISTYLYLSLLEKLYGEVAVNVFYFLSQIYAVFVWIKAYRITEHNSAELKPKQMSISRFVILIVFVLASSAIVGWLLQTYTDDSQPWLDAFTTVPALCAQVLLMLAYREQWVLWFVVDVLSAIMWARACNWCLFAQYLFWCANCIYGWHRWTIKSRKS